MKSVRKQLLDECRNKVYANIERRIENQTIRRRLVFLYFWLMGEDTIETCIHQQLMEEIQ